MDGKANEFQQAALREVDGVLAAVSPPEPWEARESRGWRFFIRRLSRLGNILEILVYPDALGLSFNGQWYIYEWPDYKTTEILLAQFFADLGAALEGKEPPRRRERLPQVLARMFGIKRSS